MQVGEVQHGQVARPRVKHGKHFMPDGETVALDEAAPGQQSTADLCRHAKRGDSGSRRLSGYGQTSLVMVSVTGTPGTLNDPGAGLEADTLPSRGSEAGGNGPCTAGLVITLQVSVTAV